MVTSKQKDKAIMKRFLIYQFLLVFPVFCFAQDTIDAINDIKLSGKYFTAEATASIEKEAKELAFMGLMEKLSSYCEEMEMTEIGEGVVRAALLSKSIKRGDAVMVLVYVAKDIVNGKKTAITFTPNVNVMAPVANDSTITSNIDIPNVIKQICEVDTYASVQYLLDKAMDNGLVEDWGKCRTMAKSEVCYLLMVNIDRQIIGVLSPKRNGARLNVRTGAVMDAERMNTFTNCVPICVLVK